jgi:transketolase
MRAIADLDTLRTRFGDWEVVKDLTDGLIDLMLNYRQSGHPGGSRSKVQALVALFLSGALRVDLRDPTKAWADRFVLCAGHTAPAVYALLAVLNDALREAHRETGDARFAPRDERFVLYPEHLTGFRRRGGLPGHAEMSGRTLLFRWNTGPSGHGLAAAVGQALALRHAGADEVLVWGLEGEGGLTPGVTHEALNSAWGLGLDNLRLLIDWNDWGIDPRPCSAVVYGGPKDWLEPHGWRVHGTGSGNDWEGVTALLAEMMTAPGRKNPIPLPVAGWFRTQKGRGYLKYDAPSHGAPHKLNSELFWETRRPFQERYGVRYQGFGEPLADEPGAVAAQFAANLDVTLSVLRRDRALVLRLAEALVSFGDAVPERPAGVWLDASKNPCDDPGLLDATRYPAYKAPGSKVATRQVLSSWGAWVNATSRERHGRPLFLAASADLAESTGLAGFAEGVQGKPGWGWYERVTNRRGALLPQEITEMVNAGLLAGAATVNLDALPLERFNGVWGATSTYGSFSYLKYGMARLFAQVAQDSELKVGKLLWVVGHTGPETAEDSRTHFGVFAPGVTRLLPRPQVVNLHPWDPNEVPVLLEAALTGPEPIVALHLARPPVTVPDRAALGLAPVTEAARGAYLLRDFAPDGPRHGTVLVQGALTTQHVVGLLPEIARRGWNLRVIAAVSWELFQRQPAAWREAFLPFGQWLDSMGITNGARCNLADWMPSKVSEEYTLSADWDDRWRTGGAIDEVYDEAHLSPAWLLAGIERFVEERPARVALLRGIE